MKTKNGAKIKHQYTNFDFSRFRDRNRLNNIKNIRKNMMVIAMFKTVKNEEIWYAVQYPKVWE